MVQGLPQGAHLCPCWIWCHKNQGWSAVSCTKSRKSTEIRFVTQIEDSEKGRLTWDLALENVTPVCRKAERMLAHIKTCKFISTNDQTLIILTCKPSAAPTNNIPPLYPSTSLHISSMVTPVLLSTQNSSQPIKRSKSLYGASPGGIQYLMHTLSASQLQEEFSTNLCKLLIALNTAWVAAKNPLLHRSIHKWVGPEVIMEDRQILSGWVLDWEVEWVEKGVISKVSWKLVTGQCDGFKNVAKSSVVSTMMSVEYEVSQVIVTAGEVMRLTLALAIPCTNTWCYMWS